MNLRKKLYWISVLYFASGFPFGIAWDVWPVYFRLHGVSLREIGLMSLLFLPYTLKPLWAPLADRLGSRQSWVVAMQLGLAGVCLVMLVLDPTRTDWILWIVLLTFTFLSATQDISIDAYAVDVSTPQDSGHINGIRVSLYRMALLFAGGLLLILADRSWFGWTGVWILSAAICVLSAVLAVFSPRVERERAGSSALVAGSVGRLGTWRIALIATTGVFVAMAFRTGWSGLWLVLAAGAGSVLVASFLSPELLHWLMRWEMLPVVGVVVLYKVGDSTLGRMVKPFWVDRGMTPSEIGVISSGVGMWLTIAGAILGGWYIQRKGIFSALLWMGIAQLVSNFGYVLVVALDLPRGDMTLLGLSFGPFEASIYLASIVESITQGLGTAAFLSFLMNLCDKRHSATQYALLSALFALTRDVAGAFSGIGVEALGYAVYFSVTAALALPALLLLPLVRSHIREAWDEDPVATLTEQ
ncbi:MAG: AmpG family muropeptide MFS transporter [bacterium]|nr:AmpG family muropeptide MFS transporter [bacterium]